MKTVTIEGQEYEVPDEAQWIAQDADGRWIWYFNKPVLDINCGIWDTDDLFGVIPLWNDWQGTLQKID